MVFFESPEKSSRSPLATIASVRSRDLGAVHPVQEDRHGHGGHLLVGDVPARVGVDQPADLGLAEFTAVALRADQVDDVEGFNHAATVPKP